MAKELDKYEQSSFLIIKVTYMYYLSGISQSNIAKELGISVTTVSRLLKKGREKNIIEFVIRDSFVECLKLEKDFKKIFGLMDVVIAPAVDEQSIDEKSFNNLSDGEVVKKLVALEAARYLQRIITNDDILGITWGSTIYHMINYLNPAQRIPATFVTLHGSLSYYVNEWDVRVLIRRIAKAFSGKNYSLPTNAMVSSPVLAKLLREEKDVAKVYDMFDKINISIAGIGSLYPELNSILSKPDYLNPEDLKKLQKQHVVGDIALHFFDTEGRECQTDLIDRMLSMDFNRFKRIEQKITVASGVEKAYTVYSALKGGLIDTLIVDNQLAEKIFELHHLEKDLGENVYSKFDQ
ncbi:sugar-binding transcriptional regulator [Pseudoramibacter faecis]|uniref:sugar-binding transcriptional regulator n=1 Tax=Pseudoramibacter faecis TaxID=3108534 RepID=UPI002E779B49|nr:sugar-binding domain-containing protein [Pseudoramibacter sp. HA2172]